MKVLRFQTSVTVTTSAPPRAVYETVTDLKAHLVWSGERASDDGFKLLTLEGPDGAAGLGTTFSSTGANFNGTFRDRSAVTEAAPPNLFVIQTEARLDRRRGKPWEVQFIHRYDIEADGDGSRITYTDTAYRMNYVPSSEVEPSLLGRAGARPESEGKRLNLSQVALSWQAPGSRRPRATRATWRVVPLGAFLRSLPKPSAALSGASLATLLAPAGCQDRGEAGPGNRPASVPRTNPMGQD